MRSRIVQLTFVCMAIASQTHACKIAQAPFDAESYYTGVAEVRDAAELRATLHELIDDHQNYAYTPCVWLMLEEADADPGNSDNVIGIYTRRSIPKTDRDTGGNTPDAWNREHLWPRSHGFNNSNLPAHNDGHHLRAADKSVNADRDDNDFDNGGLLDNECTQCREGNGTWEAPNEVKGDIARAMLYMDVRYEGGEGVPDLELVDSLSSSGSAELGRLCTLIEWHLLDPVSAAEQSRNAVIYSWQGNRNPFVDHPEWVLPLWGTQCGVAWHWPDAPFHILPSDEEIPLPPWAVAILGLALWGNNLKQRMGIRFL